MIVDKDIIFLYICIDYTDTFLSQISYDRDIILKYFGVDRKAYMEYLNYISDDEDTYSKLICSGKILEWQSKDLYVFLLDRSFEEPYSMQESGDSKLLMFAYHIYMCTSYLNDFFVPFFLL